MVQMPLGVDAAMLHAVLGDYAKMFDIEHLEACSSTNTLLLERAANGAACGLTLLADRQTAGRGRRGRAWLAAPGHSLTFSVLWRFNDRSAMTGLSLAAGVAIAQALEDLGFHGIGLKWPNDVWLFGRKLGGVLIELLFDQGGFQAVIGIGLNLRLHPDWNAQIGQDFTALENAAVPPAREILLGTILRRLAQALTGFERDGFSALSPEWNRRNALHGLPVKVSSESGEHRGVCGHARPDGSLELLSACGAHLLISGGDVSLCLDMPLHA